MGLFKKKNPQDAFDPDVFTITDTILDPPRFTFLPAIYQDATRRKWAVHQRGGEPKIFDYADVLQCEVAEAGDPAFGFRLYPFVNDAKRRRQSAGGKQVG